MSAKRIFVASAALLCCLCLSPQARANSVINGYTSISYNATTNLVTGVTTTELDYSAQEWYMGRVIGRMTDSNGNSLGLGALNDTDRDGTVSTALQAAGGGNVVYTCKGTHGALADVRDYSQGSWRWVDYHNFGYRTYDEGLYVMFMAPFYGPGPSVLRNTNSILLGNTLAALPQVSIERYRFDKTPPEVKNGDQIKLTVDVSATSGYQTTDQAVVELVTMVGGVDISYTTPQPANITPSGVTSVTFTITVNTGNAHVGEVPFRIVIDRVRRPDGEGGFTTVQSNIQPGGGLVTGTGSDPRPPNLRIVPPHP